MKLLMSFIFCAGVANASGITDDLNSVYSENAAAISSSYTADEKPASNKSAESSLKSTEAPAKGTIESNVLRGVKSILVQNGADSQITLEESVSDRLGYGEKYPPLWTVTREEGFVSVKCAVTDPSYSDHVALWDVVKKDKNYCIQPKNIRGFVELRPAEAPQFDPILSKYLCEAYREVDCASLGKANWEEINLGFPCFAMEKSEGGRYIVKYPKVEAVVGANKEPQPLFTSVAKKTKQKTVGNAPRNRNGAKEMAEASGKCETALSNFKVLMEVLHNKNLSLVDEVSYLCSGIRACKDSCGRKKCSDAITDRFGGPGTYEKCDGLGFLR